MGLVGLLSHGCVERSQELTAAQRERVREFVSTTPTTPQHPLDIAFGDRVELVGYDLRPARWGRGQDLRVTWHWKVLRALDDGFALFTHIEGAGADMINQDGGGTVRQLYPPMRWQPGEYILDEQTITLPGGWPAAQAAFYLGFWRESGRLPVVRGPNDGDQRARALTVDVVGETAEPRARPDAVPQLDAMRRREQTPIAIDGIVREAGWAFGRWTELFVETMRGGEAAFEARAKVSWDAESLYVAFRVEDDDLRSPHTDHDSHLWEEDCVEIMVDPDGDGRNYFELQVSPRGVVFDTRYDSRRVPQPIGHADWDSGLQAAVHLRGTLDDDQGDEGYDVEVRIPWTSFTNTTPPSLDTRWRIAFYVMNKGSQGQTAAAWSPPRVGDFHMPARFGEVRFRDRLARSGPPGQGQQVAPARVGAAQRAVDERESATRTAGERARDVERAQPGETVVRPAMSTPMSTPISTPETP